MSELLDELKALLATRSGFCRGNVEAAWPNVSSLVVSLEAAKPESQRPPATAHAEPPYPYIENAVQQFVKEHHGEALAHSIHGDLIIALVKHFAHPAAHVAPADETPEKQAGQGVSDERIDDLIHSLDKTAQDYNVMQFGWPIYENLRPNLISAVRRWLAGIGAEQASKTDWANLPDSVEVATGAAVFTDF